MRGRFSIFGPKGRGKRDVHGIISRMGAKPRLAATQPNNPVESIPAAIASQRIS